MVNCQLSSTLLIAVFLLQNLYFMQASTTFQTDHTDVIHNIAYDFYGKRVATASADGTVKIWNEECGSWSCVFTIKAHATSVYKVSWASPECGTYIATCGADRSIHVYEEYVTSSGSSWRRVSSITSLPDVCMSLEFAPSSLRIAAAFADGVVRIYQADAAAYAAPGKVGGEASIPFSLEGEVSISSAPCVAISWNQCPFDPPMFVVAAGNDAHVVEFAERGSRWVPVYAFHTHTAGVTSVVWAPSVGRTSHTIVTGCQDGCLRVHHYYPRGEPVAIEGVIGGSVYGDGTPSALVQCVLKLDAAVSSVAFDATGSLLVSSDETGRVHTWRQDFTGTWELEQTFEGQ